MKKIAFALFALAATASAQYPRYLAINTNQAGQPNLMQTYEISTGKLVRTLDNGGNGGASGNARALVQALSDKWLATINTGSSTMKIWSNSGYVQTFPVASPPVSIAFGPDPYNPTQLYVAGTTTLQSFALDPVNNLVTPSGTIANLNPSDGSTAQVSNYSTVQVAVSIKTTGSGAIDLVSIDGKGAVTGTVTPYAAPGGTTTLFSMVQVGPGALFVQFAHSNSWGVFSANKFQIPVPAPANVGAPCWATTLQASGTAQIGILPMIFTANTTSLNVTTVVALPWGGVELLATTPINTGGQPGDIDGRNGLIAVLDHVIAPKGTQAPANISVFKVNSDGTLFLLQTIPIPYANANGITLID